MRAEVCELREGTYARAGVAATGLVSEIPGCPDLVLDLDALWAAVDDLDATPPGGPRPSSS
jgi:hypothetical protein